MFFYKKLSPNAIICDIIANGMKCGIISESERKINYDGRLFYHA